MEAAREAVSEGSEPIHESGTCVISLVLSSICRRSCLWTLDSPASPPECMDYRCSPSYPVQMNHRYLIKHQATDLRTLQCSPTGQMQRLCNRARNRKAVKKQKRENKNPIITKNTSGDKEKSTVGETAARMTYKGWQSQFREGHLVSTLPGWILAGFWPRTTKQNKKTANHTEQNKTKIHSQDSNIWEGLQS